MKRTKKTELGTVHCPSVMMLRIGYGTAEDEETSALYEMSTSIAGYPIITSKQTGQNWSIGWPELLALAVKNGIDKPFADISEADCGA